MRIDDCRSTAALLLAGFLLIPAAAAPAAAEEPVETAVREWVAALDASPTWSAKYGNLTYDAATKTATLTGLVIHLEGTAYGLEVESISLADYAAASDGGFSASQMTADGGAIDAGVAKIAISDVILKDVGVPGLPGFVYDPEKPFTSIMRAYADVARTRLSHGEIGTFVVVEQIQDVTSKISYGKMEFDGLADGKIGSMRAGPIKFETPSPEGLISMTMTSVESRDMDLNAFIRVYNPDAYVNGVGDKVWHQALGFAAYHDIAIEVPGAKITLGEVAVEAMKMRQPEESFGEMFDIMIAHPDTPKDKLDEMAVKRLPGILSAFSIGRFGFENLAVEATGVDRLSLGGFHLSDFSSEGLGEFSLDELDGAVEGVGSLKLGKFAFGGIVFPSGDAVKAAIHAAEIGSDDFDVKSLVPTLGFFEVDGLDVATPDVPRTTLDKLRLDLSGYIGPVPTSISGAMTGFDFPVAAIEERESRETLERLGYDHIIANYGFKADYDEANEQVKIGELSFGIDRMGAINSSAVLSGLPRSAIDHPEMLEALVPALTLVSAKLTFTDASIVGKGLDILAEKMKAPPDKFRAQFADAMPFLLSMTVLTDPQLKAAVNKSGLLAKLAPAVKTFLAEPGSSITVTLKPPKPIAIPAITAAAENAPDTLAELLGIDISGETAKAPLAPEPAPAPAPAEPAPAPAPSDDGAAPSHGQEGGTDQGPTQGGGMRSTIPAQ